jgi:hypothetical protein
MSFSGFFRSLAPKRAPVAQRCRLGLESLEDRETPSGMLSIPHAGAELNPQPLPPGIVIALNPQPLPPCVQVCCTGTHF